MPLGIEEIRMQDVQPGVGNSHESARTVESTGNGLLGKHVGRRVVEQRMKRRSDLDLEGRMRIGEGDETFGRPAQACEAGAQLRQSDVRRTDPRWQTDACPDIMRPPRPRHGERVDGVAPEQSDERRAVRRPSVRA